MTCTVLDEGMTGPQDPALMESCRQEGRLLVTFDLGFGDVRVYPPGSYPGVLLLRLRDQHRGPVLEVLGRLLATYDLDQLKGCLTVVTEERVRVRRQ